MALNTFESQPTTQDVFSFPLGNALIRNSYFTREKIVVKTHTCNDFKNETLHILSATCCLELLNILGILTLLKLGSIEKNISKILNNRFLCTYSPLYMMK